MIRKHFSVFLVAALSVCATVAKANDIGSVDTEWELLGPNHKIKVSSIADPDIDGVHCFVSRPITGGLTGWVGLAEDPSDTSIACRQTGPIRVKKKIVADPKGELIANEKRSAVFKTLNVQRFYDPETKSYVYLTFSTKLINGSPKNSISVVTPQTWEGVAPILDPSKLSSPHP
jgi:CreA protein